MTTQEMVKKLTARGVSYMDIAHAVGVETLTVRRWELGTRKPQAERAVKEKLARMLAQCQRNQKAAPTP